MKTRILSLSLSLCLGLFAVSLPVFGQDDDAPSNEVLGLPDDGNKTGFELEDTLGYGYHARTGELAIAADVAYVYCPDIAVLAVHPDQVDYARGDLKAIDNRDGTWTTPDGGSIVPQIAKGVIDDGSAPEAIERTQAEGLIPIFAANNISLVHRFWSNQCRRVYQYRRCDPNIAFRCLTGICFSGTKTTFSRTWYRCRYTGSPFDFCVETLRHLCTSTHYTCRDCTGPITGHTFHFSWACHAVP